MAKLATVAMPEAGLKATIQNEVNKLVQSIMARHPDAKHNAGRSILETFIWDEIQSVSKGRSDTMWERMEDTRIYLKPDPKPGHYECGESPHFVIKASVTSPVRRFNEAELAAVLEQSIYKIPPHQTKGFVDAAKKPGNPMTKLRIVER